MTIPRLMFEQALTPIKGWFDEAALDFEGILSAAVTFGVPAGRCVHVSAVNPNGNKQTPEFEMGVAGTQMGMFLIQGSGDFDVSNPGTTASGSFMHQAIAPTGVMSALVAEGAYELQTTEYDAVQTYLPNDLLTAGPSNSVLADGGILTNQTVVGGGTALEVPWSGNTTRAICGVVSRGVFLNEHRINALHFWPTYIPGES